jgi:hypothetical protein
VIAAGSWPSATRLRCESTTTPSSRPSWGEVECRFFFVGSGQTDQVVEDLGYSDGSQGGVTAVEQRPNFPGRELGSQIGDDRG